MLIKSKNLTPDMLEQSTEIQAWLSQFDLKHTAIAKRLLLQLQFITRDDYANWLLNKLGTYQNKKPIAIYAVRKFKNNARNLWLRNGNVQSRPSTTQGSEDLVASILSNAKRRHPNCFLDHPSLELLRKNKVRDIILVDDSIGSGNRVSKYIGLMNNNPTFKSWWSYGLLALHILSYARTRQSKAIILDTCPGSNHPKRKFKVTEKVNFDSTLVYNATDLELRWGIKHQDIYNLCKDIKRIPHDRRMGFGDIMGNLIFYHSVPNNIPGMLHSKRINKWEPLFPSRSVPDWLISLLETNRSKANKRNLFDKKYKLSTSNEVYLLLSCVKKGLRTQAAIARKMDYDRTVVSTIFKNSINAGLLTESMRLTKSGYDLIKKKQIKDTKTAAPDYSLYVPFSWCAGQRTIQPSALEKVETDSVDSQSTDGGGGESSLERTDAKAPTSPISVTPHYPAMSWGRDDTNGPKGLKE